MTNRWRAYFELLRLPAVFTAMADVMMGYLVTQGTLQPTWAIALLIAASSLIYLAGMVLNDVNDVEGDAVERPQRPIPSGRISLRSAKLLGWGLLAGGVIAAWFVTYLADNFRPGIVATLLVSAVVLYDIILKQTAVAPLVMGSCRALNVLLGMSLAESIDTMLPRAWTAAEWTIAAGIGIYITGVTIFARTEASATSRARWLTGTIAMLIGIAIVARSPIQNEHNIVSPLTERRWYLLWTALAFLIGPRCAAIALRATPNETQLAVRSCLRALIAIDAVVVFGFCGPIWASAVLALFAPMFLLERWFSTT